MEEVFTKFLGLKPEKKQRIINASIKEFTEQGFKNASTDKIVKVADISKGALFHYFKNKKSLFLFLYDYSLKTIGKDFFEKIDLRQKDVFLRLKQIFLLKITLIGKYPDMFNFIKNVNYENDDEIKKELKKINDGFIGQTYKNFFLDFDKTLFKDSIDIDRTFKIIMWTIEGISNEYQEKVKFSPLESLNYQQVIREVDSYLDILKAQFYK